MKLAWAVVLACAVGPAAADPPQAVALASTDAGFRSALASALAPGLTVTVTEATPPSLGELAAGSREVADREHAAATVWLIGTPTGATLVAYDRAVDRVLVRELPYPLPLGATQAAEAARMTRTMLRALRAMPENEQAKPPLPPPAEELHAPPVIVPEPDPVLGLALAADVHLLAPGADALAAASLTAIWRPRALGATVSTSLAPSANLMTAAFEGNVRDTTAALSGRFPLRLAPRIEVAAEAGLALHFVHIEGVLVDGEHVDTSELDPAIRVGFSGTYALRKEVDLGLGISVDTLLRRQMFDAGSSRILIISRLQLVAGAFVAVQIL